VTLSRSDQFVRYLSAVETLRDIELHKAELQKKQVAHARVLEEAAEQVRLPLRSSSYGDMSTRNPECAGFIL
jgi:hypothetical protein